MATNDEQILALKSKIDEKKKALGKSERFSPITNCVLPINGQSVNINVLDKNGLQQFLIMLNSWKLSAIDLKLEDVKFGGYVLDDWINDIQSKLAVMDRSSEVAKLKKLEERLTELLSDDKKIELELGDILSQL